MCSLEKNTKIHMNILQGLQKLSIYFIRQARASFIKKLEVQLGKIAEIVQNRETSSLPSSTETNPRGLAHAITTRSRLNYKPPTNPIENNKYSNDEQNEHKNVGVDNRDEVKEPKAHRNEVESYVPPIPFPGRLKKEKEKEKFRKFFKNLQQLSITSPLRGIKRKCQSC
ncbi:hypothetical protein Tco_0824368 [Tanacetum coccineum]|uniref:Uncharacterized protein n=1 Tax=Tanacetum coccineum TaxID=301880 RepID=A0ABQ5AMB1_9ASTR